MAATPQAQASRPMRPPEGPSSSSLFELPVSRGAKTARVVMILGLNLLLLGGGAVLFMEYLDKRETAAQAGPAQAAGPPPSEIRTPGQPPASGEALAQRDAGPTGPASTSARRRRAVDADPADSPPADKPKPPSVSASSVDAGTKIQRSVTTAKGPRDPDPDRPSRQRAADAGASAPVVAPPSKVDEERRTRIVATKVAQFVSRQQGQLNRCYRNAAKVGDPNEPPVGRVEVQFTVQATGAATSVSVSSNQTGSPALGTCVVKLVRSWRFPAIEGEPLVFVWPFEFEES